MIIIAATVDVYSWNAGSDGSPVKAATPGGDPEVRLKDADSNTVDASNPVVIEGSLKYSYWKHIAINIAAGGFTQIDNIRHSFASNSWTTGTAGMLQRGNRDAGDHGCPEASYNIADGKVNIDTATTGHLYYEAQTVAVVDVDAGEADIVMDSGPYTAAADPNAVVFQVVVDTDATAGDMASITNTWKWDEI